MLPVANGVLFFNFGDRTPKLIEHQLAFKFTYKLAVTYDPTVDQKPLLQILLGYVAEQDYDNLIQIPAQTIMQHFIRDHYKKASLILGEHDASKTTYLDLLKAFFGKKNVSDVCLHAVNERFSIARMEGKIINIHDDLRYLDLKDVGKIKQITGGADEVIERKCVQGYEAELFLANVFTANNAPPIRNPIVEKDDAFFGRWNIFTFCNRFTVDPNGKKRIINDQNLSALLNLVIEMMWKIHDNHGLIVKHSPEYVRKKWMASADSVFLFVEACYSRRTGVYDSYFEKITVFEQYLKWCKENRIDEKMVIKHFDQFCGEIKKHGFEDYRPTETDPESGEKIRSRVFQIVEKKWTRHIHNVVNLVISTSESNFSL